mmetsp:Transcript_42424/g.123276  ORF Transcript_42424/g.123276 Transcript_42424/m.123276 type:complete len:254 (+) Transcript_42424:188-949(+)
MSSSCFRCAAACLSSSRCCSTCNIFANSASAVSVGGSPSKKRSRAVMDRSTASSRSFWSLCAEAWCMESSLTVAIIFRVTSLMRDWKALTFCESSNVPCLPSIAWCRNFSERAVTSSRINSFSNKASFLSFSLSSKSWILTRSVSLSRSSPFSFRHLRRELLGFSSSRDKSSVCLRTLATCSRNRTTSSTSFGTSGMLPRTTRNCRCTSERSIRSPRISSCRASIASSPFFRSFSWMLDFSQSMHSSSFLSMS